MKKAIVCLLALFTILVVVAKFMPANDYIKTGKLYINEILAKNSYSIKDDDGDYSDYIEIFNDYSEEMHLKGYHLSDDEFDTNKWTFPDIVIGPHSYLVVFASKKDKCDLDKAICHTNFKLSSDGEVVTLSDDAGSIISKIGYKSTLNDISYGFVKNKYDFLIEPTPGQRNAAVLKKQNGGKYPLKITEYMSHNKSSNYTVDGGYYDWVEIYNDGDKDINLLNVNLSDNRNKLNRYKMPNITLKGHEYIIIYLAKDLKDDGVLHADFNLSDGEELILSFNGKIIDSVKTKELNSNVSYGLYEGKWYYYYTPTPGSANDTARFETLGVKDGNT